MLQLIFAVLSGAATTAGPCILPLLPIILGASTERQNKSRPVFIILGFISAFVLFALIFAVFGSKLGVSSENFRKIAAVIIGLFGLVMFSPKIQKTTFSKLQPFLNKVLDKTAPKIDSTKAGLWSGFILGASLGLVWTPCAGPVLGAILTLAAAKQNLIQAAILLFFYSLGAGLPMLVIAYGGHAASNKIRFIAKHTVAIQKIFGIIIVLVAIAMFTGAERHLQAWLAVTAPWLFINLQLNL